MTPNQIMLLLRRRRPMGAPFVAPPEATPAVSICLTAIAAFAPGLTAGQCRSSALAGGRCLVDRLAAGQCESPGASQLTILKHFTAGGSC